MLILIYDFIRILYFDFVQDLLSLLRNVGVVSSYHHILLFVTWYTCQNGKDTPDLVWGCDNYYNISEMNSGVKMLLPCPHV